MNLIRHTISRVALLLIPFIILGSVLIYITFRYIAYDEIDEFLLYEMDRINQHYALYTDVPDVNSIVRTYEVEAPFEAFFADTLLLETGDMEMVPHRELHFSLTHNERHLGIVLHHLMLGDDDIIQGALLLMVGMALLVVVLILVGVTSVTRTVWQPFFSTLGYIRRYEPVVAPDVLPSSTITEFELLNGTLNELLQRLYLNYERTKSFNENAAHELQTQLALIKTTNENLLNRLENDEEAMILAQKSQSVATRASHMLRSLLLLSKIGNREFRQTRPVDVATVAESILAGFGERIAMRKLSVEEHLNPVTLNMDEGLAEVLFTNLIKNAVVHSESGSVVKIDLTSKSFRISNTAAPLDEDPAVMLQRFKKGKKGNTGLGLSIVSEICTLYGFSLRYTTSDTIHTVEVCFDPLV